MHKSKYQTTISPFWIKLNAESEITMDDGAIDGTNEVFGPLATLKDLPHNTTISKLHIFSNSKVVLVVFCFLHIFQLNSSKLILQ